MFEPRESRRRRRLALAGVLLLASLPPILSPAPLAAQQAEEAEEPRVAGEGEPVVAPAPPPVPEPAVAPEPPEPPEPPVHRRRSDAQVVVGSSLVVDEDEVSDSVLVVGGSLTVLGEVLGDAAAIGGPVVIEGRVTGDVSSVGGPVSLGPESEVMGDAMSFGGKVARAEGAVVRGEVVEVTKPGMHWSLWPHFLDWSDWSDWGDDDWLGHAVSPFDWLLGQAWRVFTLLVLVLFACLALLLARRPIDRIGRRVALEPWKAGLVGLAAEILFVPLLVMLVVILAVSIIGIPFILLLPFALVALAIVVFLGYVGVAVKLGELVSERFGWKIDSSYLVLALGILGLEIWSLIGHMINFNGPPLRLFAGLFLLFGFFVGYVAWTLAVGGAVLTRFATAEGWGARPAPPPPPAPQLEPPPAPPPGPAPEEPWEPEIDAGDEERRL